MMFPTNVGLLAIWDDGQWERWGILAAIVIGAYLAVMWAAALYWVYRDAMARSRDPLAHYLAVGAVAVFNLPGLLLYLILRPKTTLTERYEQQLEAEALLHEIQDQPTCPQCRRRIGEDYLTCPYCRASLRVACESCRRRLRSDGSSARTAASSARCRRSRAPVRPSQHRSHRRSSSGRVRRPIRRRRRRPRRSRRRKTATDTGS